MRKDRVEARLAELGITQFEAAERAGKNSHFIYDFLTGRKRAFKGDGPERVASALQCSIAYLTGESDEIGEPPQAGERRVAASARGKVALAGVVEAGYFRKIDALRLPQADAPITPNPAFPADAQTAYLVRGDDLAGFGVVEGMFLIAVPPDLAPLGLKSGALVIVRHTRLGGREVEISARELQFYPDRTEFATRPMTGRADVLAVRDGATSEPDGRAEIVGLVISATRIF